MRLLCNERVNADEFVDDPAISITDTRDTVFEQAIVNRWLGGARATLAHAVPLLHTYTAEPVRVLEAACGGADLSRQLAQTARRLGKHVEIVAMDLHDKVVDQARQLSAAYPEITCVQGDALSPPFAHGEFDIVMLPTFIHHLQPDQVVALLKMAQRLCRGTVIVADLVRSPLAYIGFWFFSHMVRFCPVTIHDGLVSVCRAYTPNELANFARRAGLTQWNIYRHQIDRMVLVYAGMGEDNTGEVT
ncbi:MAG TPA: methyltransferase domain-containing protein [Armatimonadota bacterium]|nr:methyltransferase domain-containing protein [Armatimonadota bacterium]